MVARLSALLALCAAAVTVTANPIVVRNSPVSLPIARRVNTTGVPNILKADQARAKVLKARSQGQAPKKSAAAKLFDFPVSNQIDIYIASVGVGSPPTYYNLIVDTGSSNTWIGAGTAYTPTNTSTDTGEKVQVGYGSGSFFGEEYTDQVTLGSDFIIKNQSIGVATKAYGFDGVDGILGIGPVDLTVNTTSNGEAIPTVLDNALTQGLISAERIGISFEPAKGTAATNGELTFGGVDPRKFIGEINYVPITSTSPASEYVGIDESITYGSARTPILSTSAGITDTGTTLVLIASDAAAVYQNLTGAVQDNSTGLLKITQDQFANLESLFFHIGHSTYELTPNAQIWPRALNTAIGGDADSIYLIVGDLGSHSGEGLDFINGYSFLERFYFVFDVAKSRAGFAPTPFTHAKTN